jgi:hypothetical protein
VLDLFVGCGTDFFSGVNHETWFPILRFSLGPTFSAFRTISVRSTFVHSSLASSDICESRDHKSNWLRSRAIGLERARKNALGNGNSNKSVCRVCAPSRPSIIWPITCDEPLDLERATSCIGMHAEDQIVVQ